MLFWLFILVFAALFCFALWHNAIAYFSTSGSLAERLAAAWRDSLTHFVGVWSGLLAGLVYLPQMLAQFVNDPNFATLVEAVKTVLPPSAQAALPIAIPLAMMWARNRTL